jgi:hypothetical protein
MQTIFALLEVMDKEPTLTQTWLTFLGLGVAAGLLARRWRRTLWVSVPVFLLAAGGMVAKFADDHIGPAIRAEAGWRYIWLSAAAIVVGALGVVVGARFRHGNGQTASKPLGFTKDS